MSTKHADLIAAHSTAVPYDPEGNAGMDGVQTRYRKFACSYCLDGPERGWIETDNNGPIIPCPVCNFKTDRELEYEKALRQRTLKAESQT